MSNEFVGAGWAFPLQLDQTGGFALVADEREIEEAIRLILGTAYGERPMRPDSAARIHDFVFADADAATAGRIAYEVRVSLRRWEPRIDVDDVEVTRRRARPQPAVHRHPLPHPQHQRPAQPRVPVLHDPASTEATGADDDDACPSRTSTTAASRTSSTTPSGSSSSAAQRGPTTTCPTRA